jgi:hypothetical protein
MRKFHATMIKPIIFSPPFAIPAARGKWGFLEHAKRLIKWLLKPLLTSLLVLLISACAPLRSASPAHQAFTCEGVFSQNSPRSAWQSVGTNIWLNFGQPDALSTPVNQGHISNVVFVLDTSTAPAQGWLVGSGPDAASGRALACGLKQSLGLTVTDAVSPRAHPESVLGAAGLPGVRHWALPQVQAAMAERCERCLKRLEIAVNTPTPLVPHVALPDHLIQGPKLGPFDVMTVEVQAQEFVALLRHRASDTWLLPGVAWGQGLTPQLREADASQLLHILERLSVLKPTKIIPEQGEVGDSAMIRENISYWQRLLDRVNERWQQGENQPGNASGLLPLDAAGSSEDARLRDQLNAQRAWQQMENKGFDAP